MTNRLIGFQSGRGFLYSLSGASKLIFFILVSVACMTTYDTRLILAIGIFSVLLFKWRAFVGTKCPLSSPLLLFLPC